MLEVGTINQKKDERKSKEYENFSKSNFASHQRNKYLSSPHC